MIFLGVISTWKYRGVEINLKINDRDRRSWERNKSLLNFSFCDRMQRKFMGYLRRISIDTNKGKLNMRRGVQTGA